VFILGVLLCIGSMIAIMALYAWAALDWNADSRKPIRYRKPVRHVAPRYLVMGSIGALVGLLLVVASQPR
jgi:uncharacterized membrane protein YidH (DUF202 family)